MTMLKKIYMLPVWIIALVTQAKSFTANPVIGSKILNICGLHVLRILLARASTHFRWLLLSLFMPKNLRHDFHKNGFIAIENFIPPSDVTVIRNEIKNYKGDVRQMSQGDTATQRFLLTKQSLINAPTLSKVVNSKPFRNYLIYTGAKATLPMLYIQRIRNGFKSAVADPQKNMHSDTFHPTMKAWLFLEDVTEEMGPFTYVPTSNQLTKKRLLWEYRKSSGAAKMNDKYSERGSLRATDADLDQMNLPSPTGITATAGTLVIANTNGFHGRGQAQSGANRLEIWAYSRHNPFNPYPGVNLPFVPHLKHKIMTAFLHRKDKKAQQKGAQPSWKLIPEDEMLN